VYVYRISVRKVIDLFICVVSEESVGISEQSPSNCYHLWNPFQ